MFLTHMFSGASDDMKPIVGGFDVHALSNRKTGRENMKNNREREQHYIQLTDRNLQTYRENRSLIHILCADFIF